MKIATTALKVLLSAAVIGNSILGVYLFSQVRNLKDSLAQNEAPQGSFIIKQESADLAGYATKDYVESMVLKAPPTPVPTTQALVTVTATPMPVRSSAPSSVSYLPIGGTLTTTSTEWADVAGSEFWADFNSDFGQDAKVSWEATLKIAAGSGRAIARLVDSTHGIELLESQIYTESGSLDAVTSGQIYPWAGRNLYKVQVRSLISTEATFGGGKVKVVY